MAAKILKNGFIFLTDSSAIKLTSIVFLPGYIFNKFIYINQADKILEYNKMFFNISINQTTLTLVNLSLAITSIYFLKKAEVNRNKILKTFRLLTLLLMVLISMFNIWGWL